MYLPPLQPMNNSHFCVSGNVTIHPSAVIAPGVLLQADPESRVIIAAGVCIGMGAILHAYQGTIEVEEGANIGAGVLMVGNCKIGANACIGSATTILNSSIGWGEVVSPASLIGDKSHQIAETKGGEAATTPASHSSLNQQAPESLPDSTTKPESLPDSTTKVYGQAKLNQLLSTLLPYRQSLTAPLPNEQSSSNSS